MRAVTFDYGQTLARLDTAFLARRVAERGAVVESARLDAVEDQAWAAYDVAKQRRLGGYESWCTFMSALLTLAGTKPQDEKDDKDAAPLVASLVDYLWSQQPTKNLWRRAIPGMTELLVDLKRAGVPLGIVSNSEGRLAELVDEMGWGEFFPVIGDSGKLGIEKPEPGIFEYVAGGLGVPLSEIVHIGDVWAADVDGALGVGARAIWFTQAPSSRSLPEGVVACSSAAEILEALRALGFPV
jgi:putative hydrolase of the HAD superfamily